jgi:microcystin degradation protein MlrC
VGGKRDTLRSAPIRIQGTVCYVGPARYTLSGHGGTNVPVDMGPSAVVRSRDVTVLLVSRPGPGGTPSMYRCVGLEPQDYRLVVVKSPSGFRADFGFFAEAMIVADTPGAASGNLRSFTYSRASRPLWPLDEIHRRDEAPWTTVQDYEAGA